MKSTWYYLKTEILVFVVVIIALAIMLYKGWL